MLFGWKVTVHLRETNKELTVGFMTLAAAVQADCQETSISSAGPTLIMDYGTTTFYNYIDKMHLERMLG